MNLKCKICKKEFKGNKFHPNQKYCSQKCRIEGCYKTICKTCGKKIWKHTYYQGNCQSCSQKGNKNSNWKGDNVKYKGLHIWIKRHKQKPTFCECCGKKPPYDLANISGKYKRDITDFEWLCRSCHMEKDGRLKTLKQSKRKKEHTNGSSN